MDGTAKYLLILDLSATGHHPTYIRRLLESDLSKSANIILASRKEMFLHSEIRPLTHCFTPYEIAAAPDLAMDSDFTTINLIRHNWKMGNLYRKAYERLSRTADIEFVVVPFLDDCLLGLALPRASFGTTPWLAITMRTMFHFGNMGIQAPRQKLNDARRHLFERLLNQRFVSAVLTIDPTLAQYANQQRAPCYKKIEYLPDPALYHEQLPTKSEARRRLDISDTACVILLYGEIAERKGVFNLLEAAADAACDNNVHVLLAGRHERAHIMLGHPAYLSLAAQGRVHRLLGFIDDDGERTVLAAADCVWVGYKNFYLMSGILVMAGRHGLPVIATKSGLVGYWTQQHDLGIAVDIGDRPAVISALNRLARDQQGFASMGNNGVRVFAQHEPAALQRLVMEHYMRSKLRRID